MMGYTSLTVWAGTEWYGSEGYKDSWDVEAAQSITTADGQPNNNGNMFLRATAGNTNVTIAQLDVADKNTDYTLNIQGDWNGSNHFDTLVIEDLNLASADAVLNIAANNNVQVNNIGASPQSGGITVNGTLQLAAGVGDTDNDFTISVQKGGTLKLHHSSKEKATANTQYNFGTLNVANAELQLELWTAGDSDKRNVDAASRPIITSAILLDNSTMRIKDGSYQFDGGITVKGTSTLHNEWSKGHTINTLKSDGVSTLKLVKQDNDWGNYTPWVLLGEGAFSGRVEMTNQDAATHSHDTEGQVNHYLVLSNGKALSNGEDTYSTVVNLGNGNYDDRNFLSLNTAESYLKGIGGKGVVEICTLEGNAGLTVAKLTINNDGSVEDIFGGTISSGVTLEISGGSQTFGQITNNGTIVLTGEGKYVVQNASEHAGFSQSDQLLNHDGQIGASGFITGTISLYKDGSTGSGPDKVVYAGKEVVVTDGKIAAAVYNAYHIGSNVSHTDVYAAAQKSNEAGDTLSELIINNGGTLTVNATLAEKNAYYGNSNEKDKDPFFSGSVKINGGGILNLAENSLGWGTNGGGEVSPTLTLAGTNETTLAKVTLNGNQTAQTTFNMNGHALIESSGDSILIDTMSTVVNVSGSNNEIAVQLRDRGGITYDVANDSALTLSGKILAHPGSAYSGTAGTIKKGGGEVIFTAAGSVFSGKVNVQGGTLTLSGENTTLNNGAQVAGSAKLLFATTDSKTITVKNGITLNGKVSAQSGTTNISGNITGNGTIEIAKNSSENTKLQLSGINQVNIVDLSNGNEANGQLIITSGQTAANKLWMRINNEILINEGASFKGSTVGNDLTTGTIIVTGTAGNNTKIKASSDDIQYWADRTDVSIINADVSVSRNASNELQSFNLANKLDNSSLSNTGSATVVVKNEANDLTGITADGGNVDIRKITEDRIAILSIEEEKIVGVHSGDSDALASLYNMSKLTVTNSVTMRSNSSLYANLEILNGVTLTLDGYGDAAATVAGSLTLNTGLILDGKVMDALDALQNGDSLAIFKEVSNMVFAGNASEADVVTLSESALTEVDASIYFTNLEEGLYYITFENNTVSILSNIPEPTTATLSLLALAALAARRRRASR